MSACCCCEIIVLKTHGPNKDESDDSKDTSYEHLEQVFANFAKNHMKILLENFKAKFGREDIFQLTGMTGYIKNVNSVRIVNFHT
jgi:hypothetical protein